MVATILITFLRLNFTNFMQFGLGSIVSFPPRGVRGRAPAAKAILAYLEPKKMHLVAWIMVILVWYKMSTVVFHVCYSRI